MLTTERIQFVLSLALRATVLLAILGAALQREWMTLALSILALALTFLPGILERNLKVALPTELEIVVVLFLYASVFLGEVHGYYTRYWWWDVLLHTSSGVILGVLGFILVYVLNAERSVKLDLSPGFMALFAFVFAVAAGAVWEIFEFSMDVLRLLRHEHAEEPHRHDVGPHRRHERCARRCVRRLLLRAGRQAGHRPRRRALRQGEPAVLPVNRRKIFNLFY